MQTKMLIGGELVEGEGDPIAVLNPATGGEIASVAEASPEQIDTAVAAAETAFETFRQSTPADRAGLLLAIEDTLGPVEIHREFNTAPAA